MGTNTLWLPNGTEVQREHSQLEQELEYVAGNMAYWTRELQQIDPDLKVFMAKPNAETVGVKPGYYHVVRLRPGHPAAVMVVEDEETGEWRDLDSSVLDLVQRADLWNDRTQREIRAKRRKVEAARQRDKIRRGQERAAQFDERLHSATHVSIQVPRSVK